MSIYMRYIFCFAKTLMTLLYMSDLSDGAAVRSDVRGQAETRRTGAEPHLVSARHIFHPYRTPSLLYGLMPSS